MAFNRSYDNSVIRELVVTLCATYQVNLEKPKWLYKFRIKNMFEQRQFMHRNRTEDVVQWLLKDGIGNTCWRIACKIQHQSKIGNNIRHWRMSTLHLNLKSSKHSCVYALLSQSRACQVQSGHLPDIHAPATQFNSVNYKYVNIFPAKNIFSCYGYHENQQTELCLNIRVEGRIAKL